jgi:hypothetical protein
MKRTVIICSDTEQVFFYAPAAHLKNRILARIMTRTRINQQRG